MMFGEKSMLAAKPANLPAVFGSEMWEAGRRWWETALRVGIVVGLRTPARSHFFPRLRKHQPAAARRESSLSISRLSGFVVVSHARRPVLVVKSDVDGFCAFCVLCERCDVSLKVTLNVKTQKSKKWEKKNDNKIFVSL